MLCFTPLKHSILCFGVKHSILCFGVKCCIVHFGVKHSILRIGVKLSILCYALPQTILCYTLLQSVLCYALGVIINPTIKAHLPYAHAQRSFLISHHCKLDIGIHKSNMYPELQMQHTVAIGLAAQNCQFDSPCDDLDSAPSQLNQTLNWFT